MIDTTMSTVYISESELARGVHAILEKVERGDEVIVERDHRAVAVIKTPGPEGRKFSEVIALLEAHGAGAVLDEDFERDVRDATASWREPWNPPSGE